MGQQAHISRNMSLQRVYIKHVLEAYIIGKNTRRPDYWIICWGQEEGGILYGREKIYFFVGA